VTISWADRRVLVTGGTGLMGTSLTTELLARGADVTLLRRASSTHALPSGWAGRVGEATGAVEDLGAVRAAVQQHRIEVVFHLAAQAIAGEATRDPLPTFEANIRGTWQLLDVCRTTPGVEAVVLASSDKAYGPAVSLPYVEDTPLRGRTPYEVSKSCADLIAGAYHATYGLPVCITRCGNLFGPGDLNWSRIVPGTLRALLTGQAPTIRTDGRNLRDYIYVGDAVDAYLGLAEAMLDGRPGVLGEAFNFSLGEPLSVVEMVRRISAAAGIHIEPVVLNEPSPDVLDQYLSSAKAHSVLGWHAAMGLDEGLRRTVPWYREQVGTATSSSG
jgi:CDP-glucose 4,6-dehydratase